MSRIGKIARLPVQLREQVNQRLQDGENGRDLLLWLNSVEEVKTVLANGFGGREITDSNLSDWRLGGYRDWEAQQFALDEARRVVAEGKELGEIGHKALADNLAVWLTGRYIVATRQLLDKGDHPEAWKMLREMCQDVVALRRGDHGAEWLRLDRERLKLLRQKNARERKKEKLEVEEDPPLPPMSEEEKERHYAQIFGFDLESHPMYQKKNPFAPVSEPADTPASPPEAENPPSDPSAGAAPAKQEEAVEAKTEDEGLGVGLGLGTEEENPEAVELHRVTELAEKGDAYSAYCLGVYYQDGFRVPKDLAKAREWLGKAASQGIGGAKIQLHALLMRHGDEI